MLALVLLVLLMLLAPEFLLYCIGATVVLIVVLGIIGRQPVGAPLDGQMLSGLLPAPSTLYECPKHGRLLPRELEWSEAGDGLCPDCGAVCTPA